MYNSLYLPRDVIIIWFTQYSTMCVEKHWFQVPPLTLWSIEHHRHHHYYFYSQQKVNIIDFEPCSNSSSDLHSFIVSVNKHNSKRVRRSIDAGPFVVMIKPLYMENNKQSMAAINEKSGHTHQKCALQARVNGAQ